MATLEPQKPAYITSDRPQGSNFVRGPQLPRPYSLNDRQAVRDAIAAMRRPLPKG